MTFQSWRLGRRVAVILASTLRLQQPQLSGWAWASSPEPWLLESSDSESSTIWARTSIMPGPEVLDDANVDSPWRLAFLNFDAALMKPAQSNLPQSILVLIELRYPFVATPHFAWLNSVAFVSFPVFASIDFLMVHDFPPCIIPSQVIRPSRQKVNARSTCIQNRVSLVFIKNQIIYYSCRWKRKSNKGIANLKFVKSWYSNRTVDVVEMSCKGLNDKGAMKSILSDYLWDESVACGGLGTSIRMTHFLFFRLLNAAKKECEVVEQGPRKGLAAIIRIKVISVCFEECIDDSKCGWTKSAVPFTDTLIRLGHVKL